MNTYIALLRGINVSGQKIIKMADLLELINTLGYQNVSTYIQSGNVIFQSDCGDKKVLGKEIAEKIFEKYGFDVIVLVKDKTEWQTVLLNNPFTNMGKEDLKRLYVTFLLAKPESSWADLIKEGDYGHDEYIINGDEIYLHCPLGYGNTKLSNTFFENKLKVSATTRNWNTVNILMEMAQSLA